MNINIHSLKPVLKERLHDHFIQQWFTDVENSSRGEFYSICKFEFGFEKNLFKLSAKIGLIYQNLDVQIMKFPIETGRWQNIASSDRICTFCRDNIALSEMSFIICLFANIY